IPKASSWLIFIFSNLHQVYGLYPPYHRLMLDPNVEALDKKTLESTFLSLDLLKIREEMDKLLVKIKSLSLGY
ncbi:MAG: hypothetical protein PHT04_05460, partial [Eubacteriales bacterium]|nr:hypothetical protein [Eubacteriales bacterium]